MSDVRAYGTLLSVGSTVAGSTPGSVLAVDQSGNLRCVPVSSLSPQVSIREIPSGAVDGVNVQFTLSGSPVPHTESVFVNGLLQEPDSGDYTISGPTLVFAESPYPGDSIRVTYVF
jgi:hypothetical protein